MAAVDYRHTTPITAGQRTYTQNNDPSETLQAGLRQYSGVVTGHQHIADGVDFDLDGQFSDRDTSLCVNFTATDGCRSSGSDIKVNTRSWTVSPNLKFELANSWQFKLGGVLGESRVDQTANVSSGGSLLLVQQGRYKNRLSAFELSTEGPLFKLPGGSARLAAGGGLRNTKFVINVDATQSGTTTPYFDFGVNRPTWYGFGELSLPLVAPDTDMMLVNRLNLDGAVRYEDVRRAGGVLTPKVGIIYAPTPSIALKFSWGKSFKAPTLYQTGQPKQGYSQVGSTFFLPPSPTPGGVLYLTGGNPDLKPERATTWTATTTFTPSFVQGLKIEASYFNIRYRDRAVSPIPQNSLAFSPIYGAYVTNNPTRDQIQAALAAVPVVYDQGGGDPTTSEIVAIVTNYLQNASSQKIEGIDLTLDYAFDLGSRDHIHLNGAASYLKSNQRLSAGQPLVQLAGTVFRQPHWRASSAIEWGHGEFTVSGILSYIGGELDTRITPYEKVGAYTAFDLVARFEPKIERGPFAHTRLSVSALNLFNSKPPYLRTINPIAYHYDSNNYPSIGRFLSVTVAKSFS
jgi:outer membrane receptor protein involved in Fe transport